MKKSLLLLSILFLSAVSFSQDFVTNLKNSVERADGGSGPIVEYMIYLTSTTLKIYDATDFDKGVLHGDVDNPTSFELIKIVGDESHMIVINLKRAAYYELEMDKVKGKQRYRYKFYF